MYFFLEKKSCFYSTHQYSFKREFENILLFTEDLGGFRGQESLLV